MGELGIQQSQTTEVVLPYRVILTGNSLRLLLDDPVVMGSDFKKGKHCRYFCPNEAPVAPPTQDASEDFDNT